MRIQRTSRIITLCVVVLSAATIICAVISMRYRAIQEQNYAARRIALNAAPQLALGSDRLTNAARAYAATGARRYYDDFVYERDVQRTREQAIDRLRQLGLTADEDALITDAKTGSDKLVLLENRAFDAASKGDTATAIQLVYGDDFNRIKTSIMQAISNCGRSLDQRLTAQADAVAAQARLAGLVGVGATSANALAVIAALLLFYRGRIVKPLAGINQSLRDLLARKPGVTIAHQAEESEIGEVARSLESYRRSADEVETQRWVKGHVADISAALQKADTPEEFAQTMLAKLVPLVQGGCGAFYQFEQKDGRFHFSGGYGYQQRAGVSLSFADGEGIVGQCAVEKQRITLRDLPPDYMTIASGVGAAAPRMVVATPVVSLDRALAVVEIATFGEMTPVQTALLDEVCSAAALNLEILQRNRRMRDLLEQIRVSEERNRLILESSAEGIFGTDVEGNLVFVNPAACRMLGFTAEELIGSPSHATFHHHRPDGSAYPKEECPMYAAYKQGKTSRIDDEFLWRKDGTGVPVEYGATPIFKDGSIVGSVISFTDITQRKRVEAALQRSNFQADRALELTKAGYWHVPLDGTGWYNSSERAERIFGDLPTPDHRHSLEEWSANVKAGDETAAKATLENFAAAVAGTVPAYDATYAYKRPIDGEIVWIHALGHVVKDAAGKPTDMFGVTQDITAFKQLEFELREAMAKAEDATKAKSAFLANMSHEIRTPMNGIIGMTELALDTELNAEQRDYLNTVKWSADALLTLINDILDFSKIEAGRIELDPIEFLLRDAISDTLNPLALRASSKGLELAYDIAPDVPDALVADIYRLRQVIVNLVGNAIKFTEKGEVVVSMKVRESRGDERVLEVAVRDTGIGIPAAAAAKLFKPFEQADAATTRKYGGTGLGLAISRQLVELMGGEIRLESEVGRGSTFIFTTDVKVGTARAAATVDEATRLLEGKTALIVDDNETNRRILETMLSHWGLRTVTVESAVKALAALDRSINAGQPISLLITDLHMPEMDGFELVQAIRKHSALALLPVVLLTSSASPGDQQRCEELRVAARLLKPVKQSLLLDNLLRILAGESHDRATLAGSSLSPTLAIQTPAMTTSSTAGSPSLRVLLAEDNPVNVKFALKLLERAGHQVVVAGNGKQAVELHGSQPFDLILMDIQMPEMDGLEATRAIRQSEGAGNGRIPIIAMTANAMAGDREMCVDAGMDGYVAKPVKKDALFSEVERVMSAMTRPTAAAGGGDHVAGV